MKKALRMTLVEPAFVALYPSNKAECVAFDERAGDEAFVGNSDVPFPAVEFDPKVAFALPAPPASDSARVVQFLHQELRQTTH